MRSCISQNLPCACAASAASAPNSACACDIERELLEDQTHVLRELLRNGICLRHGPGAERALEIGELDDRDARVVRPFGRIARERNLDRIFQYRRRLVRRLLDLGANRPAFSPSAKPFIAIEACLRL